MRRAHAIIDIGPIGIGSEYLNDGAQPPEDFGRHRRGSAVGAVDHDSQSREAV